MPMADDRRRLVDQRVAVEDDLEERREVVSAAGPRSGAHCGIEPAQAPEHLYREGHVRAGTEEAGGVWEEWARESVLAEIECPAREALAETRVALERNLLRSFELERKDEASDTADLLGRLQASRELEEPEAIHNDIVVGERDDRASRFLETTVVGDAQSQAPLSHVAHRGLVPASAVNEIGGRACRGRVVHDDDLVPWVVERNERVETGGQALRAVPRSDDDRRERSPCEKGPALG